MATPEKVGKDFISNIFGKLNEIINPSSYKREVKEEDGKKLHALNTELGHLSKIIKEKTIALGMALGGPVGYVRGPLGLPVLFGGADDLDNLPYVAPEEPLKRIFSTARILANILKGYEDQLNEHLPKNIGEELEKKLENVHRGEVELFIKIAKIDELQKHLKMGNIPDNKVNDLDQLLIDARKKHKETSEKREKFVKDVQNSIAPFLAINQGSAPINFFT